MLAVIEDYKSLKLVEIEDVIEHSARSIRFEVEAANRIAINSIEYHMQFKFCRSF